MTKSERDRIEESRSQKGKIKMEREKKREFVGKNDIEKE